MPVRAALTSELEAVICAPSLPSGSVAFVKVWSFVLSTALNLRRVAGATGAAVVKSYS